MMLLITEEAGTKKKKEQIMAADRKGSYILKSYINHIGAWNSC